MRGKELCFDLDSLEFDREMFDLDEDDVAKRKKKYKKLNVEEIFGEGKSGGKPYAVQRRVEKINPQN